ncbi:hypothetical protein [Trichloromonas sp.]|uniref:hypothetical protein n=1 Tax=Trichloromonas sp. TaxID=3069249 RepID=UPI001DA4ED4A|nr:hypothetical protein [Desulfuromonadaceae bacterium]MDY0269087.1 hypothetical protein [Trichloromonas sp.]
MDVVGGASANLLGSANSYGTDGDDTVVALIDTVTTANSTLNPLDEIDAGLGTNTMTLNVVGDLDDAADFPGGVTFANIDTVNVRGSGALGDAAGEFDLSTVLGTAGEVNITLATAVATKVAAATDLNVLGATDAIIIDGGKDIEVTDATADKNISVGDTTESAGTVWF